jgi:hypothetical protein
MLGNENDRPDGPVPRILIQPDWFPGWRAHGSSGLGPPGKFIFHISRRAGKTVKNGLNCIRACRAMDEDAGNRTRA